MYDPPFKDLQRWSLNRYLINYVEDIVVYLTSNMLNSDNFILRSRYLLSPYRDYLNCTK